MNASVLQQRKTGRVYKKLNVCAGDISNYIESIVDDGNTREALTVHQLKSFLQRLVTTGYVRLFL